MLDPVLDEINADPKGLKHWKIQYLFWRGKGCTTVYGFGTKI
jgi:hypothetical protein